MYLIKAGDAEVEDSKPIELKGQSQDFEKAKKKALKLLKSYEQVEVVDAATNECVLFLTR